MEEINLQDRRISYAEHNQAGTRSVSEEYDAEKAAGQDNDTRSHLRLRDQPYGVYYHFKDIYDLVEWACVEDARRALQGKKTYDTWLEGMVQIFEAVLENKPFILNAYRCISRDQIERFLFQITYDLIRGVVEEKAAGTGIAEEDKTFIADFYKYSFVGIMLDWIRRGMKDDYRKIAEKMNLTLHGNITNSIRNFTNGIRE